MKKRLGTQFILTILLTALFLFSGTVSALGFSDIEDSAYRSSIIRVTNLNLMRGMDDGTFGAKELIKRCELATLIVRLLKLEDVPKMQTARYRDVSEEHYACQAIDCVSALGLMNGVGDGLFEPEGYLTGEQAIKVMVKILGYDVFIRQSEGEAWYQPYLAQANSLRLTKNLEVRVGEKVSREWIAGLLDNALDIEVLEEEAIGGTDTGYKRGAALLDSLYLSDGAELTGILEATRRNSITGMYTGLDDEIIISGYRYRIKDGTDVSSLLGCAVRFSATEDDDTAYIQGISAFSTKNTELSLKGRDIVSAQGNSVTYETDDDMETIYIAENAKLVYNGRYYRAYDASQIQALNQNLRFLDNDGDDCYDVVFVSCSEVAEILRVNESEETIQFDTMLEDGTLLLNYRAGKDKILEICNADGEPIDVRELAQEDALVEVTRSKDGNYTRLVLLTETITAALEEMNSDDGMVRVDGQEYPVACGAYSYALNFHNLKAGEIYRFTLNTAGEIVDADDDVEDVNSMYQTGYLYKIDKGGNSLSSQISVKLIQGSRVERTVEGDSTYYLQAIAPQKILNLTLAEKVKIDGVTYKNMSAVYDILEKSFRSDDGRNSVRGVIRYTVNDTGEIDRMELLEQYGSFSSQTLTTKSMIVSGSDSPFAITDRTTVFFVPTSNSDEDVFTKMRFGAGSYNMLAFDMDMEERSAGAVIFINRESINDSSPIGNSTKVKVIQHISKAESDGEIVYRISGYDNGEPFDRKTNSSVDTSVVEQLKSGDIVRFLTDYNGDINKITKIASLPVSRPFEIIGEGSDTELIYGLAYATDAKFLSPSSTQYEQQLKITTDVNGEDQYIYTLQTNDDERPRIYLYSTKRSRYYPAEFEDILSVQRFGAENASKIYLYAQQGKVRVVIIVSDS